MRNTLITLALVLIVASSAFAGSATNNTNAVKASVSAVCTLPNAFTLDFTAYDPIVTNATTDLTGSTSWTVKCTKNAAAYLDLNAGANGSGTGASTLRKMKEAGGTFLNYQLYKNVGNTVIWGQGDDVAANTTSGTGFHFVGAGVNGGNFNSLTVYGVVPQAQDVPAASYTDTVTATVNF